MTSHMERFDAQHVHDPETGCWNWTGTKSSVSGSVFPKVEYGNLKRDGRDG